jgi:hypothetical protein
MSRLLRVAASLYVLTHKSSRARAEADAVFNIHTTGEWRSLLADAGFSGIGIEVALRGRRFWFPDGLILRATNGTVEQESDLGKGECNHANRA